MSHFITRTALSTIRPLGSEAERSFARTTALLARDVSPQHALMLADPVPLRDGSGIDWYIEDEGEVVGLKELPAPEAAALKDRLAAMIRDVLEAADRLERRPGPAQKPASLALRRAVSFPGENSIWALRTPEGWRPIIVDWGYEAHDTVGTTAFDVSARGERRPPLPRPPMMAAAGHTSGGPGHAPQPSAAGAMARQPGPAAAALWRGTWPWLALLASLLLFLLIVAYLLPACGLRTPFGTIVFGLPGDLACADTADREIRPLARAAADLERDLQALREDFQRRQLDCRTAEVQPPPVAPPVVPPQQDAEFDRAIDDRGEVQVTLLWSGPDDLDLEIVCPSGRVIAFPPVNRSGCGGVLDIDANSNNQTMRDPPVENITFQAGPAEPGTYRIRVHHFGSRSGRYPVPFRVRIRDANGERIVAGALSREKERQDVTTFNK